jgi:hypothetical protein
MWHRLIWKSISRHEFSVRPSSCCPQVVRSCQEVDRQGATGRHGAPSGGGLAEHPGARAWDAVPASHGAVAVLQRGAVRRHRRPHQRHPDGLLDGAARRDDVGGRSGSVDSGCSCTGNYARCSYMHAAVLEMSCSCFGHLCSYCRPASSADLVCALYVLIHLQTAGAVKARADAPQAAAATLTVGCMALAGHPTVTPHVDSVKVRAGYSPTQPLLRVSTLIWQYVQDAARPNPRSASRRDDHGRQAADSLSGSFKNLLVISFRGSCVLC